MEQFEGECVIMKQNIKASRACWIQPCFVGRAALLIFLSLATRLGADAPPALTTIRYNGTDFEGRREFTLEWNAASNTLYRLQRRASFESNSTWETFDLATPNEPVGVFKVSPEKNEFGADQAHEFFRVLAPQPEIFRIEPAVLGTNGGTVHLFGQCFGTNISVRIGSLVLEPTVLEEGRHYTVTIPIGGLGEGPQDVVVLDGTNVVAAQAKLFSVTGQPTPVGGARLSEPPVEPPASPMAARGKKLYVGNLPFSATDQRSSAWASKRGYDRVSAANGECVVTEEDLSVPGRGLDFTWTRTYRSRNGTNTVMGQNWDHSYNLRITAVANAMGGVVHLPANRSDFFLGSNGVYTANEHFEEGTFSNGVFTLTFPDTGKWIFNSLSNSSAPGAIARIEDRNGNALTFNYDASSRLSEIIDTLGRTNRVAYDGQGRVASITDFSGRACTYTYWRTGESGGGNGDLRSVTTPPVTGTPNTNDFPLGKTTMYTYSIGFADNRLNHNLRTVVDPAGKMLLQVTYADSFNPDDVNFDRVSACTRGPNPPSLFTYTSQSPAPSNSWAVMKTICNDPVGNVTIDWSDSLNRGVIHRDLAARAVPGAVIGENNLPTAKLRDTDPDYWETRCTWNLDSLCTRVVWPAGNSDECVYERDLNPACSPRHKADIRVMSAVACCADLDGDGSAERLTSYYQYNPLFGSRGYCAAFNTTKRNMITATQQNVAEAGRFGSGPRQTTSQDGTFSHGTSAGRHTRFDPLMLDLKGDGFVTRVTDPRGNVDTFDYDAQGNCVRVAHSGYLLDSSDKPVSSFEYNSHGQLTAVVHPADANGYSRRDEFSYDDTGAQAGYLRTWTVDTQGPVVEISAYEYDAVGNRTVVVDPRGNTNRWIYNSLNQMVKTKELDLDCTGCIGYERVFFYDASDNLVRVEHDDRDSNGASNTNKPTWTTLYQYDGLNRCTLTAHEITHTVQQRFATNRFVYDAIDNIVEARSPEAVNGNQPANLVSYEYDTRNLPFQITRAPGTADATTDRYDYDPNANCVRETRGISGGIGAVVWQRTFDGFDRCVTATYPMGNVSVFSYDNNHNLVYERHDGQTNDVPGGAGNQRLSETRYEYDSLNRRLRTRVSFFDIFTELPLLDGESTTTFTYAPNGACRSVMDDNGHVTRYAYDTKGRLSVIMDPKTNTVTYAYDLNGNVVSATQSDSSDLTPGKQTFVWNSQYDALDRCVLEYDNVGNTNRYRYDSRDNVLSATNPRGNETVRVFDGLGRCVRTDVFDGSAASGITINTSHVEYNSNSRRVSATDGNSNVTHYAYDNLDRCVATTNADSTVERLVWSPRSNLSSRTDPNGTVTTFTYDDLDRCIRKDIVPGGGVASTTTFEEFAYDGVSNLILATNNTSMVEFSYNSMEAKEKAKADCIAARMTHDGVGNTVSLSYSSGRVVNYSYNALDEVSSVSSSAGAGLPPVPLATFSYDGPGRLSRMTRGANPVNTRLTWNGMQNPANAAGDFGWQQVSLVNHQFSGGAVIDRRLATYDRNQNKTLRQQTVPFPTGVPALTTNIFGYDALDRMTSFSRNRASSAYTKNHSLDSNGNRQSVSSNGVVEIYTMDNGTPEPADFQMNQYTGTPFGIEQHDHNGNLISVDTAAGSTHFTYDYANRLVSVERSAGPALAPLASFTYDALGRRISKTTYPPAPALPRTTQFLLDPETDQIIEERVDGVAQAFAVWPHMHQLAGHVRISAGGEMLWVHTDELGSALALTDAGGNVLERYDYDDYGSPRFLTADGLPMVDAEGRIVPQSPAGVHHLFRGMFWDGETGLYLTSSKPNKDYATDPYVEDCQRYVDPKAGRATTRGAGANTFTFADNNPWSTAKAKVITDRDTGRSKGFARYSAGNKSKGTIKTQGDFNLANYKEITGLESEIEIIEFKDGEDRTIHTRPGNHKAGKLVVGKDWSNTGEWYKWRKAVLDGKVERKSMSVIFHNDAGEEAGRINLFQCWPKKWKGPAMNAKNSGHATEVLEISWETMELKHK
jgi:phage tail-like protein